MRIPSLLSLAVLLATARLPAQVCDSCDHAIKSGWKRLSRKRFQYGIDDFTEAMATHAKTDAERAEALFGIGECYRNWHQYDHARKRFTTDPRNYDRAREAYAKVVATKGATPDQRSKALAAAGRCYVAQGSFEEARRAFEAALAIPGITPGQQSSAQTGRDTCRAVLKGGVEVEKAQRDLAPRLEARYLSDQGIPVSDDDEKADLFFAADSLGGTLARDHQSRAMYFEGRHRRTYIAYLDHHFMARVTYYDHDAKRWAWRPVIVDDCQSAYLFKDGHNAPNIFVSRDGTIHLFYGSHGNALKYSRSAEPECIERFETGRRIGRKVTYPYLCQTASGELLLFYRRSGPRGGYYHGHLGLRCSRDNGDSWSNLEILLKVKGGVKLCNNAVIYNAARGRVHLYATVSRNPTWHTYYFEYDLASKHLFTMNGTDLGVCPTEKELEAAGGKLFEGTLEDQFLHGRVLFVVGKNKQGKRYVGRWDGAKFTHDSIADGKVTGCLLTLFTSDGQNLLLYGLTASARSRSASLAAWSSADAGRTWDDGQTLVDAKRVGHGFQSLNLVMNYRGSGPILIAAEPTGPWPEGWTRTRETHYDNPSRRDRKLYAVDAQGNVVRGRSPFKPY